MDTLKYQTEAARTICDQKKARARLVPLEIVQLLHSIIGLMGEIGELATALENHVWYGKPFDRVDFKEEFGDLAWYLAEGTTALDYPLDHVLRSNSEKLRARFPEKFEEVLAAEENRDRAKEREILEQDTPPPIPRGIVEACEGLQLENRGEPFSEPSEEEALAINHFDPVPLGPFELVGEDASGERESPYLLRHYKSEIEFWVDEKTFKFLFEYDPVWEEGMRELDDLASAPIPDPRHDEYGPVPGVEQLPTQLSTPRFACSYCKAPISDEVVKRINKDAHYRYRCNTCQVLITGVKSAEGSQ